MSNIFSSREAGQEQAGIQGYVNSRSNAEAANEAAVEKVDDFNKVLQGVTQPIGGLMTGKPVEKLVSKAGRAAIKKLGGERFLRNKFLSKLKEASNGDLSKFGSNLEDNVKSSIQDVLQDNPPESVTQNFSKLSKAAQNKINDARERLGKSKLGEKTESRPRQAEVETEDIPTEEVSQPQSLQELPEQTQSNFQNNLDVGDEVEPEELPNLTSEMSDEDFGNYINGLQRNVSRFQNRLDNAQRDPNLVRQDDVPNLQEGLEPTVTTAQEEQAAGRQAVQENLLPEQENSTEQQPQPDNGDPNKSIQQNQDSTDLVNPGEDIPDPAPDVASGADAGTDALEGLESASEALDAAAAAQGGFDIFSDIAAGISGLALLIGGTVGGKKAPPMNTDYSTSAVQYGV
jgi:hypothetical protein